MFWTIPFGLTLLATLGLIVFYFTAEGEDVMALPLVLGLWAFITFGSWGVYGILAFILWATS